MSPDPEIRIYKAQCREDALAAREGREPRLIASVADINDEERVRATPASALAVAGVEELRALARMSERTSEYCFDGLSLTECLNLLAAVRACPWDIYADELTPRERKYAATHGKLSRTCRANLKARFG